jgi:predicted nucleotidyltransferase
MSVPVDLQREHPGMGDWAFLHGYRGSIAHGMYEPNNQPNSIDDKDTMAFCVPPKETFLGLKEYGSRGTVEVKRGEWDIVIYEARKALRLLSQGNPNVLSMLWLEPNLYIRKTEAGRLLLERRSIFVGRHVYKPFAGYASQQLYKMEHGAFKGYMGDKRKALVERYGYDTKNAAHMIRLLRMGIEFLRDGELNVSATTLRSCWRSSMASGRWSGSRPRPSIYSAAPRRSATGRRCPWVPTAMRSTACAWRSWRWSSTASPTQPVAPL